MREEFTLRPHPESARAILIVLLLISGSALGGSVPRASEGGFVLPEAHRVKLAAAGRMLAATEAVAGGDVMEAALVAAREGTRLQAEDLGLDVGSVALPVPRISRPSEAFLTLLKRLGASPTAAEVETLGPLDALPPAVGAALAGVAAAHVASQDAVAQAFANARPDALVAIAEGRADPLAPPETGVDLAPMLAARLLLLDAAVDLARAVEATPPGSLSSSPPIQLAPYFALDPAGGATTYTLDYNLVIDLGGDDFYANNAGGSNLRGGDCGTSRIPLAPLSAALIDLGGDDRYGVERTCGANGGGYLGSGFLADFGAGADFYLALTSGSNGGANVAGVGFLLDAGGSDLYVAGGNGGNGGAAYPGAGFLLDLSGADTYTYRPREGWGGLGSSGFNGGALVGGASGLLVDLAGDDRYTGSNAGVNGGGVHGGSGNLIDGAGSDAYVALVCDSWYPCVDGGGGANGGGAGTGKGFLLDAEGDDAYVAGSGGVNGGAAGGTSCPALVNICVEQPFSVGLLLDLAGKDSYRDSAGGTGDDRSVAPKEAWGFQLDQDGSFIAFLGPPGPLPPGWGEEEVHSRSVPLGVATPAVERDLAEVEGRPRASDPRYYDFTIRVAGAPPQTFGVYSGGLLAQPLSFVLLQDDGRSLSAGAVELRIRYRHDPAQQTCILSAGSGCPVQSPIDPFAAGAFLTKGPEAAVILEARLVDERGYPVAQQTLIIPFAGQALGGLLR